MKTPCAPRRPDPRRSWPGPVNRQARWGMICPAMRCSRAQPWRCWIVPTSRCASAVPVASLPPAGAEPAVRALQALCPSWPLGAHGVALLQAWCDPAVSDWLAEALPRLRAWKAEQQALCHHLGWLVRPSQANFFCVQPTPAHAARLPGLREQGIKLRDATSFGLPGWWRMGVLPPAAQLALAQALS